MEILNSVGYSLSSKSKELEIYVTLLVIVVARNLRLELLDLLEVALIVALVVFYYIVVLFYRFVTNILLELLLFLLFYSSSSC